MIWWAKFSRVCEIAVIVIVIIIIVRLVFIGTVYALSGIGPLTSFASKLMDPKT